MNDEKIAEAFRKVKEDFSEIRERVAEISQVQMKMVGFLDELKEKTSKVVKKKVSKKKK